MESEVGSAPADKASDKPVVVYPKWNTGPNTPEAEKTEPVKTRKGPTWEAWNSKDRYSAQTITSSWPTPPASSSPLADTSRFVDEEQTPMIDECPTQFNPYSRESSPTPDTTTPGVGAPDSVTAGAAVVTHATTTTAIVEITTQKKKGTRANPKVPKAPKAPKVPKVPKVKAAPKAKRIPKAKPPKKDTTDDEGAGRRSTTDDNAGGLTGKGKGKEVDRGQAEGEDGAGDESDFEFYNEIDRAEDERLRAEEKARLLAEGQNYGNFSLASGSGSSSSPHPETNSAIDNQIEVDSENGSDAEEQPYDVRSHVVLPTSVEDGRDDEDMPPMFCSQPPRSGRIRGMYRNVSVDRARSSSRSTLHENREDAGEDRSRQTSVRPHDQSMANGDESDSGDEGIDWKDGSENGGGDDQGTVEGVRSRQVIVLPSLCTPSQPPSPRRNPLESDSSSIHSNAPDVESPPQPNLSSPATSRRRMASLQNRPTRPMLLASPQHPETARNADTQFSISTLDYSSIHAPSIPSPWSSLTSDASSYELPMVNDELVAEIEENAMELDHWSLIGDKEIDELEEEDESMEETPAVLDDFRPLFTQSPSRNTVARANLPIPDSDNQQQNESMGESLVPVDTGFTSLFTQPANNHLSIRASTPPNASPAIVEGGDQHDEEMEGAGGPSDVSSAIVAGGDQHDQEMVGAGGPPKNSTAGAACGVQHDQEMEGTLAPIVESISIATLSPVRALDSSSGNSEALPASVHTTPTRPRPVFELSSWGLRLFSSSTDTNASNGDIPPHDTRIDPAIQPIRASRCRRPSAIASSMSSNSIDSNLDTHDEPIRVDATSSSLSAQEWNKNEGSCGSEDMFPSDPPFSPLAQHTSIAEMSSYGSEDMLPSDADLMSLEEDIPAPAETASLPASARQVPRTEIFSFGSSTSPSDINDAADSAVRCDKDQPFNAKSSMVTPDQPSSISDPDLRVTGFVMDHALASDPPHHIIENSHRSAQPESTTSRIDGEEQDVRADIDSQSRNNFESSSANARVDGENQDGRTGNDPVSQIASQPRIGSSVGTENQAIKLDRSVVQHAIAAPAPSILLSQMTRINAGQDTDHLTVNQLRLLGIRYIDLGGPVSSDNALSATRRSESAIHPMAVQGIAEPTLAPSSSTSAPSRQVEEPAVQIKAKTSTTSAKSVNGQDEQKKRRKENKKAASGKENIPPSSSSLNTEGVKQRNTAPLSATSVATSAPSDKNKDDGEVRKDTSVVGVVTVVGPKKRNVTKAGLEEGAAGQKIDTVNGVTAAGGTEGEKPADKRKRRRKHTARVAEGEAEKTEGSPNMPKEVPPPSAKIANQPGSKIAASNASTSAPGKNIPTSAQVAGDTASSVPSLPTTQPGLATKAPSRLLDLGNAPLSVAASNPLEAAGVHISHDVFGPNTPIAKVPSDGQHPEVDKSEPTPSKAATQQAGLVAANQQGENTRKKADTLIADNESSMTYVELWNSSIHPYIDEQMRDLGCSYPTPNFDLDDKTLPDAKAVQSKLSSWLWSITIHRDKRHLACLLGGSASDNEAMGRVLEIRRIRHKALNQEYCEDELRVLAAKLDLCGRYGLDERSSIRIFSPSTLICEADKARPSEDLAGFLKECSLADQADPTYEVTTLAGHFTWRDNVVVWDYRTSSKMLKLYTIGAVVEDDDGLRPKRWKRVVKCLKNALRSGGEFPIIVEDLKIAKEAKPNQQGPLAISILQQILLEEDPNRPESQKEISKPSLIPKLRRLHARLVLDDHAACVDFNEKMSRVL